MDQNSRLRLATRIHFALLRHFNEDVGVRTLLQDGTDAQEALWVCEASGNPELMALAREFKRAARHEMRSSRRTSTPAAGPLTTEPPPSTPKSSLPAPPQDATWSHDTSGFGLSRPLADADEPPGGPTATSAWPRPMSWLRRNLVRGPR